MYLYQEIMKVPGLTGTSAQRQAQLFKRLYPSEQYTGSYEQNIRLLKAIRSGTLTPVGTAGKTANDTIRDLVKQFVQTVQKPTKSFTDVYGTRGEFIKRYSPAMTAGVRQQVNKMIAPEIDEGISKIRDTLAKRGLFRSGIRTNTEEGFMRKEAEKEAQVGAQLYATREKELTNRYDRLMRQYEQARKTGSTFNYPKIDVTMPAPAINYAPITSNDKYSPFGASNTDKNRFLNAYRKWYNRKWGNKY